MEIQGMINLKIRELGIKKEYVFVIKYILLYIIAMLLVPKEYGEAVGNIFSTLGYFIAFKILAQGYRSDRTEKFYALYLMIAAASNGIGDGIWLYRRQIGGMEDIPIRSISTLFYVLTNVFLTFGIFSYVRRSLNKWNRVKFTIESSVLGSIFLYLVYGLYIQEFFNKVKIFPENFFNYSIFLTYATTDFLILLGLALVYIFDKKYMSNISGKFMIVGYLIWTATDLAYVYGELKSMSFQNNLTNIFWVLAIILIALSSLENRSITIDEGKNYYRYTRNIYSGIFLLSLTTYYLDRYVPIIIISLIIFFRFILVRQLKVYEDNEILKERYMKSSEELYKLANIDSLTGAYNRRMFMEVLEKQCCEYEKQKKKALLFIDADGFKSINDWHGHDVGDKVLIEIVNRLKSKIRESDFLARQGGDEFVIILNDVRDIKDVKNKINEIIKVFKPPLSLGENNIYISVSVGGALFPDDAEKCQTLLKLADISLYKAKTAGKNRGIMYNSQIASGVDRKLEIENKLYESIKKKELQLFYQPQVQIESGKMIGIEALIRWDSEELKVVGVKELLEVAEEKGFIKEIGEFVFEQAAKDIKYINKKYGTDIKVGINISPKQFHTSALICKIKNLVFEKKLKPEWIDIEIKETVAAEDEDKFMDMLHKLKKIGVHVSIDEFGTGYSSLHYLKEYPVDTLKIAFEFINGLTTNEKDYKIVSGILAMCHELEINTLAIGIEDEAQLNILKKLKCNEGQGFYFSKPLSLEELESQFKADIKYLPK